MLYNTKILIGYKIRKTDMYACVRVSVQTNNASHTKIVIKFFQRKNCLSESDCLYKDFCIDVLFQHSDKND